MANTFEFVLPFFDVRHGDSVTKPDNIINSSSASRTGYISYYNGREVLRP